MSIWKELTNIEQFTTLVDESQKHGSAFVVFKHSTRCSISSMAKRRVDDKWDITDLPLYYLDLIQYRDVSNYIEQSLNVEHQSPQLILVKNGKAIYDASHMSISIDKLKHQL